MNRWPEQRLKTLSSIPIVNGVGAPGEFDDPTWPRYVRITDIADRRSLKTDIFKSQPPEVACLAEVKRGDLLLAAVGATYGISTLYEDDAPACFAGYLVRVRPKSYGNGRFLSYWTESMHYWDQLGTEVIQATIQNFSAAKYRRLSVPWPSSKTRMAIVGHLDSETSRVDSLIDRKQRFIDLLLEKRTALITLAVTKGLDSDVEMKDSGVEWLGEIPATWDVVGSKRLFSLRRERARGDDCQLTASQAYGVIPQADFMEREGRRVVQVVLDPGILKHVEPGDFVISMRSFQGGLERSAHRGCVSSAYVALKPADVVHARFFTYLLKCASYIQALQSTTNLVRDGQALRYENFAQVPLPAVPMHEQGMIATFLDAQVQRMDALVDKTRKSIDLLKEYRTALISAAVTGQIEIPATGSGEDVA